MQQQNYFQLFDLAETFEIDGEGLAEKYRQLQSENHPDRFAGADEAARLRAVQFTSLINEAYATLKSPLRRAGYMLQLQGFDTERVEQADLGADLLLEQMQLREALEELGEDDAALDTLATMKKEITAKFGDRQQGFGEHMQAGDAQAAKKIFHEMQFLHKLLSEIDQAEEQRLGY